MIGRRVQIPAYTSWAMKGDAVGTVERLSAGWQRIDGRACQVTLLMVRLDVSQRVVGVLEKDCQLA